MSVREQTKKETLCKLIVWVWVQIGLPLFLSSLMYDLLGWLCMLTASALVLSGFFFVITYIIVAYVFVVALDL